MDPRKNDNTRVVLEPAPRSPSAASPEIYSPSFVRKLFDEMSGTYGVVNVVSSFGFCVRWRRQCVEQIGIRPGDRAVDLMTGMGELCPRLAKRVGHDGHIAAVDLSPRMCETARRKVGGRLAAPVEVLEADALDLPLPVSSADVAISSFGLKTFSPEQIETLARQVYRLLRPGGSFSFLEISMPPHRWLRALYGFYLARVIPVIGKLFMGNPDNYRMLGVYTSNFGDCTQAARAFEAAGFRVQRLSYFFGCATAICGSKPD